MNIFGVRIDNLDRPTVLSTMSTWLTTGGFHRIATVNPEFLLLAHERAHFRESLRKADLCIADGVGIHFPFWLSGEKLPTRFPGADLMQAILHLAETKGYTVGLVLYENGLSTPEEIITALRRHYPNLAVQVVSPLTTAHSPCTILFCNYGAPLQELYLESLREKQTNFRLVMGVGGAFDFLTGALPRAPRWMQHIGLEWLWRLMRQPSRFRRIWNAVIVFPIKVLSQK